ncbi:MAG: TolC family protein [Chitinophagaceae bacterium]
MKRSFSRLFFLASALLISGITSAASEQSKSLTLETCYAKARANYPLLRQLNLIKLSAGYSLENAARSYYPQININGQASYQSAVTEFPISLPNVNIPSVSKDQYKVYTEVTEPLTDLFTIKHQQNLIKANQAVQEQQTETEIFKLKDRINQIFFGILVIDAQEKQTDLLEEAVKNALHKTEVAIKNQTALQSNADQLQAEILKIKQQQITLQTARQGFLQMLSLFIGEKLDENTQLTTPTPILEQLGIARPELRLYDLQRSVYDAQNELITQRLYPHFNLFFQGGYGRPALNFLSNDFTPYYLTGLRLNWNISAFYTSKSERKILNIGQQSLDVQKETFLFNTKLSLAQENSEMKRYKDLISTDAQIVALREKVAANAETQLQYGSISTLDYLNYTNSLSQAQQDQVLHQMQLLLAQYKIQNTTGN